VKWRFTGGRVRGLLEGVVVIGAGVQGEAQKGETAVGGRCVFGEGLLMIA